MKTVISHLFEKEERLLDSSISTYNVNEMSILGVYHGEGLELLALAETAVDLRVLQHQRVFVGHENLVRVHTYTGHMETENKIAGRPKH